METTILSIVIIACAFLNVKIIVGAFRSTRNYILDIQEEIWELQESQCRSEKRLKKIKKHLW